MRYSFFEPGDIKRLGQSAPRKPQQIGFVGGKPPAP